MLSSQNMTNRCAEILKELEMENVLLEERFPFVFYTGCAIAMLGLASSLFLIYVLTRPAIFQGHVVYLIALCIFDMAIILNYVILIAGGLAGWHFESFTLYKYWNSYLPALFAVGKITQSAQTHLILAATIERYLIVNTPGNNRQNGATENRRQSLILQQGCTKQKRILGISLAILLAILFKLSCYWELRIIIDPLCQGFASISAGPGPIARFEDYQKYKLYFAPFIEVYIPFSALLYMNCYITYKLHRSEVQFQSKISHLLTSSELFGHETDVPTFLTSSEVYHHARTFRDRKLTPRDMQCVTNLKETHGHAQKQDATKTMIAIVTGYLIANTFNVIIGFLEQTHMDFLRQHIKFYTITADISSFLVLLVSSTRLPIFFWCNSKMRAQIQQTLRVKTSGSATVASPKAQCAPVLMPPDANLTGHNSMLQTSFPAYGGSAGIIRNGRTPRAGVGSRVNSNRDSASSRLTYNNGAALSNSSTYSMLSDEQRGAMGHKLPAWYHSQTSQLRSPHDEEYEAFV